MNKAGLVEIRPKVIFQQIEQRFSQDNIMFHAAIPTSNIGGLTLLESAILVSLVKLSGATRIFEFGTYLGATSLLLASNTSADACITTLDLPPEEVEALEGDTGTAYLRDDKINDQYLRNNYRNKGALYIDRATADIRQKIHRIHQNSLQLQPAERGFDGHFDFIFIDGGHEYGIVRSDTQKALEMAQENAIIVWHDYRSNIHKDVTNFVDEFSRGQQVIHVQNTMLAIHFKGEFANLISA